MKYKATLFIALLGMIPYFLPVNAQQPGLVTKTFETKEGKITVYLPSLSSAVTISGTVMAEPSGNNEKAKSRNSEILKTYRLAIAQKSIAVTDGSFSLQVPATNATLTAELKNNRNETIARQDIPVASFITPAAYATPSYFTSGEPFRITGTFDGNFSNTQVTVNGARTELLAEGAGQLYCKAPADVKGNVQVQCSESGKKQTTQSHALQLDMTADKLSLLKGENTMLHIKVSGLEGLKEKVPLSIQNQSSSTITLEGGSTQQLVIDPASCGPSGVFTTTRNIQSLRSGQFAVSATIEPPSTQGTAGTAALLCNCFIDQQTHLLPQQQCQALGGVCAASMPDAPETGVVQPGPSSAPVTSLQPPKAMNPRTGTITLQLTSHTNDVAAVIFSSRPSQQEQWTRAGSAIKKGDNWECDWSPPLGNDGGYIVRAKIADKYNSVSEKIVLTAVTATPFAASPRQGERISLSVSDAQLKQAEQKVAQTTGQLNTEKRKLSELEKKYQDQLRQAEEKRKQAEELATIDKTLEKISTLYRDSLKALIDSLEKLKAGLPPQPDPAALKKNSDDADQRLKDCLDRLEKLKQEKADLEKQRDDLKKQQDDLLKQMDQLHLGNGWIGGSGYHSNGLVWYGYVGDENSNTNIDAQSRNIDKQLRGLNKPYMKALKRLKDLDKEIADAEAECDKLKKAAEEAEKAEQTNNQAQAVAGQAAELNRQIQSLLDLLRSWCAAHPGLCKFQGELAGLNGPNPTSAAALQDFLNKIDDVIAQKQQLEKDLEKGASDDAANAQSTAEEIEKQKEKVKALEEEQKNQQAEADRLRQEREKQLEAERAAQRKKEEEARAAKSIPKPQPTLPQPVDPSDDQVKFQAQRLFRDLYQQYWIDKGPCHCITKAIALANNTNTIVTDIIGRIGVGVAFAPLEAFPGLSFGAKLGLGAAKALGSALFGGQSFSDELAKNLFNVIGGEIFPKLTGDEFTGNRLNELASGGIDKLMEAEGVRSTSWEGETELRECGKVKGKTVTLINPNTGWVTIMIKIDNCPLVVIKYKINKDGVPISKPSVQTVNG